PPRSGDNNRAGQSYGIAAFGESNGTWRLRITEDNTVTVGDNVNMAEFWFTDGAYDSSVVYRAYSQPYNDPAAPTQVLISADDGQAPTGGLPDYEPIVLQAADASDNPVEYVRTVTVTVSGSAEIAEINGTAQPPLTQNATFDTNDSGQAYLSITDSVEETVTVQVSWAWAPAGSASVPVVFTNTPAPFILNRYTVDRNGDGYIDAVRIVFNTNIDDSSIPTGSPLGYGINGASGLGFNSTTGGLDTADDNDIYITFNDGILTSGDTPTVSYARPPGTTTDSGATAMPSQAGVAAIDRAGPAILSARTFSVDTVEITFSENVDDTTLDGTDFVFSGFSTAGSNGPGVNTDTGATPNDNVVYVFLTAPIGTEETGSVRLSAAGVVQDTGGNGSIQTAAVAVTDGIVDLADVVPQKGGVAIVSNVINPGAGQHTRLLYRLKKPGYVTIQVFTLSGDIVAVLARGNQSAGEHDVSWDGRNSGGRIVAKGIYFIRIVAPGIDETRKVLVVK
ncbi:MAG: FlgD immunoglobulin-like domain containing protein, partial [Spirochaetia bacterium]